MDWVIALYVALITHMFCTDLPASKGEKLKNLDVVSTTWRLCQNTGVPYNIIVLLV